MGKLIIYHGSSEIRESHEFGKEKAYNDYGKGGYCTEHLELAKEWACSEGVDGYANRYEIETDDLKILYLTLLDYSVLNWLALLMRHRRTRLSTPLAERGREYLLQNFLPDYQSYDAIVGYRADDSYFSFARAFIQNEISLKQLEYAMRLGKLGEQFVLKSRKACDEEAREAYRRELEKEDLNGIFMRDIIREEMSPNDPRLR